MIGLVLLPLGLYSLHVYLQESRVERRAFQGPRPELDWGRANPTVFRTSQRYWTSGSLESERCLPDGSFCSEERVSLHGTPPVSWRFRVLEGSVPSLFQGLFLSGHER